MEREELKRALNYSGEDCACSMCKRKQLALAEFDRLKEFERMHLEGKSFSSTMLDRMEELKAENEVAKKVNASWYKGFDTACRQRDEAQSWLDKISEPIKDSEVDYTSYPERFVLPRGLAPCLEAIGAYLDSQGDGGCHRGVLGSPDGGTVSIETGEGNVVGATTIPLPSEKPKAWHTAFSGSHDGLVKDCPTCNPPKCEEDPCNWGYITLILQPDLIHKYFR